MNFSFYFDRIFAGNEMCGERYRVFFEKLGNLGFERGEGVTSMTVCVLMVLRSYNDRKKLNALAKLSGQEEGFGDYALELKARLSLLPLPKRAHEGGEGVTEEDARDGVYQLGRAHMRTGELGGGVKGDMLACFRRTNGGFERLFAEDHAKTIEATKSTLFQTTRGDKRIAELRALWERVKVKLPEEAATSVSRRGASAHPRFAEKYGVRPCSHEGIRSGA